MENKHRIIVLLTILVILFMAVILRLFDLQILHHQFYLERSQEQRTRIIKLASQRGDIFDCRGNVLATSVDSYSVLLYRRGWLARKLSLAGAQKLQKKNPKKADC